MQNTDKIDIAKRFMPIVLRRHRDEAGLSQQQLADKVGIAKSYISSLELGYRAPNLNLLVRIALALDVSAGRLVEDMVAEAKRNGVFPKIYLA